MPATAQQKFVLVRFSPVDPGQTTSVLVTPDGQFWAAPDDLRQWQLPLPTAAPRRVDDIDWIPLERIKGLDFRFDACRQELWMDAAAIPSLRHRYNIAQQSAIALTPAAEPGGFLNFDLLYTDAAGARGQAGGTAELGAFTSSGHGNTGLLFDGARVVRLESQWSRDWPERIERLTLGDAISRGGLIGQSLRFGGVQWGTEFSLQPDLVTFPQPNLRGQAALPSSVDVYVNQVLRAHQDVPAGNFELREVPVVTGSGNVQLLVRDVLGRSQLISYPFYAAQALLRPGLSEYSVQAGATRRSFGFRSDDYGQAFGAGRFRNGLDEQTTGEAYVEAAQHQQMAGAGLSALAEAFGIWSLGIAGSNADGMAGYFGSLGFEHAGARWNAAAAIKAASEHYAQLGEGVGSLRSQFLARLGFVPHANGSFNLSYLRDDRHDRQGVSILAANYGLRLRGDWYVNAGVTRLYAAGASSGFGGSVGLTHAFGGTRTFSAQEDRAPGGVQLQRVTLQQDPPSALGLGYRLAAEEGSSSRALGAVRYTGEKGGATLEGERSNGLNAVRVGASSALALLGHDLFWTRRVDSSFAVVDAGAPEVRIYQDNHLAGRSDSGGLLLVPGLRAFERNSLRVDDDDLPLRYTAQALTVEVAPPAQSGVRARFAVQGDAAVNVMLRLSSSAPVPVGAALEVDGVPLDLPVGYNGQALITAPSGAHRLRARWRGGQCTAGVTVMPDAGADIPAVVVSCKE